MDFQAESETTVKIFKVVEKEKHGHKKLPGMLVSSKFNQMLFIFKRCSD